MSHRLGGIGFVGVLAGLSLSLFATGALAKGASSIEIVGPGLTHPLMVSGNDPSGGYQLWPLMIDSGFLQQSSPDGSGRPALSQHQRSTDLGLRYTISYSMDHVVVQYVFPFARPRPLTYMPPGQPYSRVKDGGGWYEARPRLVRVLVGFGLPATAAEATRPTAPSLGSTPQRHPSSVWLVVGLALVVVAGGSLLTVRSRKSGLPERLGWRWRSLRGSS